MQTGGLYYKILNSLHDALKMLKLFDDDSEVLRGECLPLDTIFL